jgi:hypothetical protein
MFVNPIDFMKPPEVFHWWPIPTVVRLKAFNDRSSIDGYMSQFTINVKFRVIKILNTVKNRKLRATTRTIRRKQCQLPNQIVEGRTQVVGNFPDNHPPTSRGMSVYLDPNLISSIMELFKVGLGDDFVWQGMGCQEQIGFPIEIIELFFCPNDFELSTF